VKGGEGDETRRNKQKLNLHPKAAGKGSLNGGERLTEWEVSRGAYHQRCEIMVSQVAAGRAGLPGEGIRPGAS